MLLTDLRTRLTRLAGAALIGAAAIAAAPAAAAQLANITCPKSPMRLAVIGDSLADGLWGALYRGFARCKTMQVLRLTEVSDGLAKTSSEAWLRRYLAARTPLDTTVADIAIVQIGANDITTIRNGASRVSFATEQWQALYAQRAASLASGLKARTSEVLWFGLPVVGNTSFEGPYQSISALQKRAVRRAGGTFVDIHTATKFGSGGFSMNGVYAGRMRQLRATDKVHFTKAGYDFVANEIQAELARLISDRDRRAALQDVQILQ